MNNPELQRAWQIIENTGTHLFLTGKSRNRKNNLPTQSEERISQTHSHSRPHRNSCHQCGRRYHPLLFPTAICTFHPRYHVQYRTKTFPVQQRKINIIRSMDLLIIDEISMVRADLLDAIDSVLRRYRDRYKPFGGVQLLMIGDLQQLAPVVKETEWNMLNHYYDTSYFFGSLALKKPPTPPSS